MGTKSQPTENTRLVGEDGSKRDGRYKDGTTWGAYISQIVIAGTGFLADAYDLFVIDLVMSILMKLHPEGMGPWDKSAVASATLVGAIIGQISFGLLGDWFGRKWTFVSTCFLIIAGTVLSGCCIWTEGGFRLVHQLVLCRLLLGIGVGGEYPLAATIAAEGADSGTRGKLIAAVFSMQGWGMLLSCLIILVLLWARVPLEYIWRIALIAGAVPSALVVFLRTQLQESEIFQEAHGAATAAGRTVSLGEQLRTSLHYMRQYWHPLIGTTMTWLILDITFYGTGSFKSRISSFLVRTDAEAPEDQVWHEAVFATLCVGMAIPGYLMSVAFIERIGRFNLQLGGFIAMAASFGLLAALNARLTGDGRSGLVILFGLTLFFSNFGPNTTTFVLPVEVYPTLIRATCHGLSAAAGKLGAVIGVVAFSPCEEAFGLEVVLASCAVVCVTGAVFTWFFTSDAVVNLRDLDKPVSQKVP